MADEGRFKTDINLYEKARPEYTKESVEYLLDKLGVFTETTKPLTILELGAGTGKFTRVLIEVLKNVRSNVRIIASDSQASMCEKFKLKVPGIEILQFKAENINLPDASVDVVIAAQAMHWFSNAETMSEIHRVLVPKGTFGMIWNTRNYDVDWVAKTQEIIEPIMRRDNNPNNLDNAWMIPIKDSKLFSAIEGNQDLSQYQEGLEDDMVNVIMCISSIAKLCADEKKDVEEKVRGVLSSHPDLKDKTVFRLPYVIPIYWCTKL